MFRCPKCGYLDLPCWKAHRYLLYVTYCRIDDLESFEPELAARLRKEINLVDGGYFYHLTKSGYVHRTTKELKDFILKRGLHETPTHSHKRYNPKVKGGKKWRK